MLFPDSPRVIYAKNPLAEVICQFRFPRILRIDAELPVDFQERIRSSFPVFTQSASLDLARLPGDLSRVLGLGKALGAEKSYEFSSADGAWKVTLTSQSLALVAKNYHRWEQFKERLAAPLLALNETYRPAFFSRVGLRYQDLIRRSVLGLGDVAWGELLTPRILGELVSPELATAATDATRVLILQLSPAGEKVRLQHGLARAGQDPETCYLIDGDFFVEQQVEPSNATTVLDRFNRESGRLFRWCIESRLHQAMAPEPAG